MPRLFALLASLLIAPTRKYWQSLANEVSRKVHPQRGTIKHTAGGVLGLEMHYFKSTIVESKGFKVPLVGVQDFQKSQAEKAHIKRR